MGLRFRTTAATGTAARLPRPSASPGETETIPSPRRRCVTDSRLPPDHLKQSPSRVSRPYRKLLSPLPLFRRANEIQNRATGTLSSCLTPSRLRAKPSRHREGFRAKPEGAKELRLGLQKRQRREPQPVFPAPLRPCGKRKRSHRRVAVSPLENAWSASPLGPTEMETTPSLTPPRRTHPVGSRPSSRPCRPGREPRPPSRRCPRSG